MTSSRLSSPAPNSTLFLGDVHLGGFDPAFNARLEADASALVRHCTDEGIRIVIHGDLFDYWMEYPGRTPDIGRDLRDAVKAHSEAVGPVRMVTGNHDNWMLGMLRREGFEPESEFLRLDIEGRHVFVMHGDGLADPRFGFPRPVWHRMIRHPLFCRAYRFLPYAMAIGIMRRVSVHKRRKGPDPADIRRLDGWIASYLESGGADVVIAGHHHETRHRRFTGREYLNPGAFFRTRTAVLHTTTGFSLVSWNPTANCLDPFHDR